MGLNKLAAGFAVASAALGLAGCEENFDRNYRSAKVNEMGKNALSFLKRDKDVCAAPDEVATLKGVKTFFNDTNDEMSDMLWRLEGERSMEFFDAVYRYGAQATSLHLNVYGSKDEVTKAADIVAKLDSLNIALRSFVVPADGKAYVPALYQVDEKGNKALNLQIREDDWYAAAAIDKKAIELFMAQLAQGTLAQPGTYAIYKKPFEGNDNNGWVVHPVDAHKAHVEPHTGIKVTNLTMPQNPCLR
jgi:hypothetical protein